MVANRPACYSAARNTAVCSTAWAHEHADAHGRPARIPALAIHGQKDGDITRASQQIAQAPGPFRTARIILTGLADGLRTVRSRHAECR